MPDPKPPPGDGPILSGAGPAWPPPPGEESEIPPSPAWTNGRATFQYGDEIHAGQPHIIWRRVGTHAIFQRP